VKSRGGRVGGIKVRRGWYKVSGKGAEGETGGERKKGRGGCMETRGG